MPLIDSIMNKTFGLIMLLVGIVMLLAVTPTLAGMITKQFGNGTGYVSNASGCFYKAAAGAGGDVQDVLGLWCLLGTLGPYIIAAVVFMAVIGFVIARAKGIVKF